jgi:hypothetical protein
MKNRISAHNPRISHQTESAEEDTEVTKLKSAEEDTEVTKLNLD